MTSLSMALAWATVHVSEGTSAFITITPSSMVMLVIIVIASRGATASAALCMPRYHWLHEAREYARARFGVRSLRQGASARHRPRRCAARAHYRWCEQRHLRAAHHPHRKRAGWGKRGTVR